MMTVKFAYLFCKKQEKSFLLLAVVVNRQSVINNPFYLIFSQNELKQGIFYKKICTEKEYLNSVNLYLNN